MEKALNQNKMKKAIFTPFFLPFPGASPAEDTVAYRQALRGRTVGDNANLNIHSKTPLWVRCPPLSVFVMRHSYIKP